MKPVEGLIKCRLVHGATVSVILPDALFLKSNGWIWFQPRFFSAPLLTWAEGDANATLSIEPIPGLKLMVRLKRSGYVRSFDDGSHLYQCEIDGPFNFATAAAGKCEVEADHQIGLHLFHHTNPKAATSISASNELWGSPWNFAGTKKLANVSYAYFTQLPKITCEADLREIALSSDGTISLQLTNTPGQRRDLIISRGSTRDRTCALPFLVPIDHIAPNHVWFHPAHDQTAYYEVAHFSIYRVGLNPGTTIPVDGNRTRCPRGSLRQFDYVIVGNADSIEGLAAPYEEEDTRELLKIERCTGREIFSFWQEHPNSDQYSGKNVKLQRLVAQALQKG